MAITLDNVLTNLNTYLGDTSEDRISNDERYQSITEATTWLLEELGNEHMVNTYKLDYLDTVNYYKVTSGLADLLIGGDLRRPVGDHYRAFTRKSPREIAEEISKEQLNDPSWAVERRDGEAFLAINYNPKHTAKVITDFENVTGWVASSDATNITLDNNEYRTGSGSLNFDIDVSLDGSNTATLTNASLPTSDLTTYEDVSSFLLDVYIPDVDDTTSFVLYWGSGASDYWFDTVTTDLDGNAFTVGWNTLKFDWSQSTMSGAPDVSDIDFVQLDMNYGGSQADDTDFRLDHLRIARPETLTFHYVSWNVGEDSGGSDITAYTAGTDVPFYSGRYDQYRYAVAHKAASILFYSALRLTEQGAVEESEAIKALQRYQQNFESNKTREIKSFKVHGVNLRRGNRRR